MRYRALLAASILAFAPAAEALLSDDYEKLSYKDALERVKSQPGRHIMIYFGQDTFWPPCIYVRNQLSGPTLRPLYKPNYLVVEVDTRSPGVDGHAAMEKFGVRWAPSMVFVDSRGKVVLKVLRGLENEKHGILINEYVSQKLYAKTDLVAYYKANFNATGTQRVVPETRVAAVAAPVDDRPRLRDVLARKHERVAGDELKKMLPGMRMEKENQDWFLTLNLTPGGKAEVRGNRKNGKGKVSGPGAWYVTRKGKFCVEVKADGLDETWCRHVFRVGENYYYAVKDLREKSLAYRFTLEKA
jgi:thioredoxin-related protein